MKHPLSAKPILLAAVGAALLAIPAAADNKPAWTHFTDPNEHAFTMDVPAGWHVQGGMSRRGPIDVSPYMRVESPDGQQLLMLGDAGPVYFQTPGFGARGPTHRYLPGEEYVRNYVQQSVAPLCDNLRFQSGAERADIANGLLAQQAPRAQHDAGEAIFSCSHAEKAARVYMVAATFLYVSPIRTLPGTWGVVMLAGCIAPPDRLDASRKIVLHMLVSSRYDRQWVLAQQARVDQPRVRSIRLRANNSSRASATGQTSRREWARKRNNTMRSAKSRPAAGHLRTLQAIRIR